MMVWIAANAGNILVLLVLAAVIGLIIRSMCRDRKKGKSCGCGSCKGCAMGCCHSEKE